jgi:hypothetical protein
MTRPSTDVPFWEDAGGKWNKDRAIPYGLEEIKDYEDMGKAFQVFETTPVIKGDVMYPVRHLGDILERKMVREWESWEIYSKYLNTDAVKTYRQQLLRYNKLNNIDMEILAVEDGVVRLHLKRDGLELVNVI